MGFDNKKKNKVDAIINEALESERLKQGANTVKSGMVGLIKFAIVIAVIGFALLILGVMTGVIQ